MGTGAIPTTKVGIGAIATAGAGDAPLVALGIGSCIALCLWDATAGVGGMAHVMLPDSALARGDVSQPGKYADTALVALLAQLAGRGGRAPSTVARITGGAQMFSAAGEMPTLAIGQRNEQAVRRAAERMGIAIVGSDCGGTSGRTVEMIPSTGAVIVRTLTGGTHTI